MAEVFMLQRPLPTHWRRATCAEVGCIQREQGWVVVLDPSAPSYAEQRRLAERSGRRFEVTTTDAVNEARGMQLPAGLEALVFAPGQECFREHRVPVEREPVYLHQSRGRLVTHASWESWRDEFNERAYRAGRMVGNG